MKKDEETRQMLGRQIRRFIVGEFNDVLDRAGRVKLSLIAEKMNEYYGTNEYDKNYVKAQFKSPQWEIILWLEERYNMDMEWFLHGEKNKNLKSHKL